MTRSDEQVAALSQEVAFHSRRVGLQIGVFIPVIRSSSVDLIPFFFLSLFYWCLYRRLCSPRQSYCYSRDSEPAELRVRVRNVVKVRVRVRLKRNYIN